MARFQKMKSGLFAVSLLLSVTGCANMSPETVARLSSFAGTALNIVGMNYTGQYANTVKGLIQAFNGGSVEEEQALYEDLDPYESYETYADESEYGDYVDVSPSIDAALVTVDASGELQLLDNGATLRGPGGGYAGDRVGVVFSPVSTAYVYVVAVDGTGWTQSLYPDAALGHTNPVPGGEEILLPGEVLYGLDNVPGVETIYVLAANNPNYNVEDQMGEFFGQERPAARGTGYTRVERPIIVARGLTGLRPGTQTAYEPAGVDSGTSGSDLTSYIAAPGESEVALTLWFNHE